MSGPGRPGQGSSPSRGPLQGLVDLAGYLAAAQPRLSSFARGLTIGALVGAAIAGSAIWRRHRSREGRRSDRGD